MRLAVIGGGSTYTPELVDGVGRMADRLDVSELVLMDPSAERLELVGGVSRRILAHLGHPGRVTTTTDVAEAVADADAVLLQLRVGGQATRDADETWPLECGCVGQETTGAGGLAKALRTVPVVLDIAEQVRRSNPDAWIVDFTNPVGIVTRALLQEGHRAVGLCNVAIGFQRRFAAMLDVDPERVELDHVGLNHLTWEREVLVDGADVLPRLLEERVADIAAEIELPVEVVDRLRCVPSYYLRYFYAHDEVVRELQSTPSRAKAVAAIERRLLDLYTDPSVVTKPAELEQRGGAYYSEAAVELLGSILGTDEPATRVVNVANHGTLPFLPDDHVIEVRAQVGPAGAEPLPVRPVEPLYAGLIGHVAAYERLALEAALEGGRDRVFAALLAHPLVGQADRAERLTDLLLAHNREFLAWA
ncbi:6-phospho-beta-glucosidase [Nocardioides sp. T2.26MG-1]|uniref:6-phospho-beta-glucosidase n=1 Tax=Nocardioides sp. T2.26MG-1 TaxID=3041166 RepID=UPI00247750AD|nr:6-phospho-beta-glucosidase [Nocardioides sp. T2.26MG-1]CAI9416178.1 putative 6-phospho-beta-glucosidase [Nocardioides sp. T2.26MG-1]